MKNTLPPQNNRVDADLAKQFSTCPSKANGGNIGWIIRGMASSAIEEAVLHRPVGSVVKVESEGGWHIIEVLQESEAPKEQAEQRVQRPRARIRSVNVASLADILADPDQVRN